MTPNGKVHFFFLGAMRWNSVLLYQAVEATTPTGSGKVLLAVRIVFLDRVQNLQIHVMRANQYICIFSQFSEFRIQNYEVVCF